MSLDPGKLVKSHQCGDKTIAQCPVCAANGGDRLGRHLVVYPSGAFACIAFPQDHEHRQQIYAAIGEPNPLRECRRAPARRGRLDRTYRRPELDYPTVSEFAALAESRGWPAWGPLVRLADYGMLGMTDMLDGAEPVRAWVLTDPADKCAQARRLDGKPWAHIGAKAKTVAGSTAAWPIGVALLRRDDPTPVFATEGGPDGLSVTILAWFAHVRVHVIVLTGARQKIHEDALMILGGRRIRLVEQNDRASETGAREWARELKAMGAIVDGWTPPAGFKDAAEVLKGFSFDDPGEYEHAARDSGLFQELDYD